MEFFEVKERLENLEKFRGLYRDYADFTNKPENVPAQMVRKKMEPLVPMTVESLNKVGLGGMVTRDAPVHGGRRVRVNIIKAIFRDRVIRKFSLDDKAPLKVLEAGILKYKQQLWVQKLQLFNPLFWLFHFILFMARLPLLIFRKAGYDTSHAETLTSVRLFIILFQCFCYYILAEWSGLLDWIWFDIMGL